MRLSELPPPDAARLAPATVATNWMALCHDGRAAAWLAWNAEHDNWYGPAEFVQVAALCASAPNTLLGPELILHMASELRRVRRMTSEEQACLPNEGLTHVKSSRFSERFDLASDSTWEEGSLAGEVQPVYFPVGRRGSLLPRNRSFVWVTFDYADRKVPDNADLIVCCLGLPWSPIEQVLRVTIPLAELRAENRAFSLPTLFDSFWGQGKQDADWRARPSREYKDGEPWGHTRNLRDGGPALPEIIVELPSAAPVSVEVLGKLSSDWRQRQFLNRNGPL